jgi:subtilase family serine protease
MRITGRHVLVTATFSSLLAFQVASPALAGKIAGPDSSGAFTVPAFPHRAIGFPAPSQRVKLMYHLPLRNRAGLEQLTIQQGTPGSQAYHHWLTPAQFRANFAPDASHVAAAEEALRGAGLSIDRVGSQLIYASAPASVIERNFATRLDVAKDEYGQYVAARGSYRIPAALVRLGGTLLGLEAHPRPRPDHALARARPANYYGPNGPYYYGDLKQAYSYPSYGQANGEAKNGTNVYHRRIGIVGMSDFNESDAYNYFGYEGIGNFGGALAPPPILTHNLVPGSVAWSADSDASFEADLDVQQAGGSAPGAEIDNYAVDVSYNEAFLAAYAQIVELNEDDIVSTSYGECELFFTPAYNFGVNETYVLDAYHDIFLQGNAFGVTFIFSSGDDAAKGCYPLGYFESGANPVTYSASVGVSIWADDPAATAVGGTNLTTTVKKGSLDSAYVSQQALADSPRAAEDPYGTGNEIDGLIWGSGGGQSTIFSRPAYQTPAHVSNIAGKGRLVPDIAMHMGGCPGDVLPTARCLQTLNSPGGASADLVGHDGVFYGVVGTSASAPEFAGFVAVLSQLDKNERRGNLNPLLYEYSFPPFVTQGIEARNGLTADNVPKGKYGYNVITGLGTPIGTSFIDHVTGLTDLIPAGIPMTVTNP